MESRKKLMELLVWFLVWGLCASVGWGGWNQEVKLVASDGAADDAYGTSVAIDGDILAVGAPYDDNAEGVDAGAVYLYHWNGSGWDEFKKTAWTQASAGALFGFSVAVSGDYVLVGAPYADPPKGTDAGAVYLYKWNGSDFGTAQWKEGHVAAADDHYGWSVGIDGIWMIVGAPGYDSSGGAEQGAVYQYRRNNDTSWAAWRTVGSNGLAGDELGYSVAIVDPDEAVDDDEWCFGGAPHKDSYRSPDPDEGGGYWWRFTGSGWAQYYVVASNGKQGDLFGWSAGMAAGPDPNAAEGSVFGIVGTPNGEYSGIDDGKSYIYLRRLSDNVMLQHQWSDLDAADRVSGNHLGTSVAISTAYAVMGASGADDPCDSGYVVVSNMAGAANAWPQTDIAADDAAAGDNFGQAVSVSRSGVSRLAVAAPNDDDRGADSGSVYVYTYTAGTIALAAPIAGERIATGFPYEISWTSSSGIAEVKIELSTDNGAFWTTIAARAANTGSFVYEFEVVSDQCLLRISDAFDSTVQDEMTSAFEVYVCDPTLTADLSGDCFVNLEDLSAFAGQWLTSGE